MHERDPSVKVEGKHNSLAREAALLFGSPISYPSSISICNSATPLLNSFQSQTGPRG